MARGSVETYHIRILLRLMTLSISIVCPLCARHHVEEVVCPPPWSLQRKRKQGNRGINKTLPREPGRQQKQGLCDGEAGVQQRPRSGRRAERSCGRRRQQPRFLSPRWAGGRPRSQNPLLPPFIFFFRHGQWGSSLDLNPQCASVSLSIKQG